jgi:hypothetical protein
VGQRFFHLVHQHQAQVARLQARQGGVDGDELATDLFDMLVRGARQAFAQQGHHLAVGAAALGGVLVQDHVVEGGAQDHGLLADVLVAAVAGAADDHAAALAGHGFTACTRRAWRRVVAVVGDHGGALVVHQVEAARRVVAVVDEAGQAAADGLPGQASAQAAAMEAMTFSTWKPILPLRVMGRRAGGWFRATSLRRPRWSRHRHTRCGALGAVRGHHGVVAVAAKKMTLPGQAGPWRRRWGRRR